MNRTKIEWVKNPDGSQGYTWNPITGCLNGCEYCYARKLAMGRLNKLYLSNSNIIPNADPDLMPAFYPRFWPERLNELEQGYKRNKGIFVCDMSDLFGIGVPEDWTRQILDRIRRTWMNPYCRFYLLTKQPQNLIKWSPFPDNCWVGVSCEDSISSRVRLPELMRVSAKVRYASFEPLLGSLSSKALDAIKFLDWVIIGAQTKPLKLPRYEWAVEIALACDKAGISIFIKNNMNSCEIADYPELLDSKGNLRQELPK